MGLCSTGSSSPPSSWRNSSVGDAFDVRLRPVRFDVALRRLPEREDHVLDAQEADPVRAGRGGPLRRARDRDVHLHLRRRHRLHRRLRPDGFDGVLLAARFAGFVDLVAGFDGPRPAVDGHQPTVCELLRRRLRADDRRHAQFPGDDGRV
jgi:hypothetical protein